MTTTDAVAVSIADKAISTQSNAWAIALGAVANHGQEYRMIRAGKIVRKPIVFAVCAAMSALAVSGCGSSNLLGSSSEPTSVTTSPEVLPQQQQQAQASSRAKLAVAPIMGAPDTVSRDVGTQLGSSLERQRVSLAKGGERADYTLRGYMVATKERAGTKVAYIFDLTDGAGKRVNRIQGEEMAQGGDAKNPWSAVTPELAQRISDKAASSLSGALASLGPSVGGPSTPVGVGAPAESIGSTTGSIARSASAPPAAAGGTAALVPAVVGAPGDGNMALSAAMRQELQQSGVGSAAPGQRAYSVAGRVTVGAAKDGKQPVKIDWRVTDPNGGLLATVSQNNEIQAGSLDGAWGPIANEAAQGAASKIRTLIEEHKVGATAGTPASGASQSRG